MNSHERRMYLLLAAFPPDRILQVWDKGEGKSVSGGKRSARIAELDAERLIVKLEFSPQIAAHVPLTFINAVWTDENGVSNVDVNGGLNSSNLTPRSRFVPTGSVG